MKINLPNLDQYIEEGYITVRKHLDVELYVYNYSSTTQIEKFWNETTLTCRGLILDKDRNIIYRSFQKIFNYEEYIQNNWDIPKGNHKIFEKLDGSLAIIIYVNGKLEIATRGSFESEQAIEGTKILNNYKLNKDKIVEDINNGITYVCEVIYPENRIVVDYGNRRDLVLLKRIENSTGKFLPLIDIGLPIAEEYTGYTLETIRNEIDYNGQEGFVVEFEDGTLIKIKYSTYIQLHRLITGLSRKSIWEIKMYECNPKGYKYWEGSIESLLKNVPDEFYKWVNDYVNELREERNKIYIEVEKDYRIHFIHKDRKEKAEYFKKCKHTNIMFMMLDNRPNNEIDELIYKTLKPSGENVFKYVGEENK